MSTKTCSSSLIHHFQLTVAALILNLNGHIQKMVEENKLQEICYLATVISNLSLAKSLSLAKFGGEIERKCRIFLRGFLGPANGPKNSVLNRVSNLNVQNNFYPLFKRFAFPLVSLFSGENQI